MNRLPRARLPRTPVCPAGSSTLPRVAICLLPNRDLFFGRRTVPPVFLWQFQWEDPMRSARRSRPATAAAELAVLLPFLMFLFVVTVDWARAFYFSVVIANSARQGALSESDP